MKKRTFERLLALATVLASAGSACALDLEPSLITGKPLGEIAVGGRLDIDLHAEFMASRTFQTETVLNWYNCGYSGGGQNNTAGGTFGDFGLQVPYREREARYPHWVKLAGVPAVRFDGNDFLVANFAAEEATVGDQDFALEVWVRDEEPSPGEVLLGWQSADGKATSAPVSWPAPITGSKAWRHLVINARPDGEAWYLDGKKLKDGPRQLRIAAGHRMVLGGASAAAPSFAGDLTAVRLHEEALTDEEVAHNFAGGVMLGTTLHPNIDPKAEENKNEYFRATWGAGDEADYFLQESDHFRHRVPLKRLNEMSEKDRKAFYDRVPEMFALAEKCYDLYAHRMALRVPLVSREPKYRGDGIKYKIQIGASAGGSWMGWHGELGFGYGSQAPGFFNPHELVHGCQAQTGGGLQGNYWEAHANFPQTYVGVYQTVPANTCSRVSMFFPANGRCYYHARLMFEHLAQTPEYGPMFISKLWYDGGTPEEKNEYPWRAFQRLDPDPATDLGYEWCRMVQRNVTWDYQIFGDKPADLYAQDALRNDEEIRRYGRTLLERIPYDPEWWRVPKEMAPQQLGWNLCPLTPTADQVSVTLAGYVSQERGSDWRAAFVAVTPQGAPRYSDVAATGETLRFRVDSKTEQLYLAVCATPTKVLAINMTGDFRSLEQEQFPYKVKLTGCEPLDVLRPANPEAPGAPHPNGGGFVAATATAEASAFVGPNAQVLGNSKVLGHARVEGYAVIRDSTVRDDAVVSGHALVADGSTVQDHARVSDYGRLWRGATAKDHVRIMEHATQERATCGGYAVLKGVGHSHGPVSGTALIDGCYCKGNEVTKGKWFTWSWGKGQNPGESDEEFGGLYLRMTFDHPHPWMARDDFGVTWGYLVGQPQVAAGQLHLNGVDQFVELQDDVAAKEDATLTAKLTWKGKAGERLFEFAGEGQDSAWLSPSENGQCVFTLRKGDVTQTLSGPALPVGQASEVMLILAGDTGLLFLDGKEVARNEALTLDLEDIRATECYLGRGREGHFLKGSLDSFEVYSVPLKDETPPTPDPARLSLKPLFVNPTTVVVQAEAGQDPLGNVEYRFEEVTGGPGGDDSGWIKEPYYVDTALDQARTYAYRVTLRDSLGNTTQPSAAAQAKWEAVAAFRSADGVSIAVEAEDYHRLVPGAGACEGVTWQLATQREGFVGKGYLVAAPDRGKQMDDSYATQSPRLDYVLDFPAAGDYCVWVRGWGPNPNGDSVHYGLDLRTTPDTRNAQLGFGKWQWLRHRHATFHVKTPGLHTFSVWMREDGATFDRLLITNNLNAPAPEGAGPPASPQEGAQP